MVRVQVPPEMLSWACERAGHDVEYFARRIPQLTSWIQQEKQPTLNQLEKLARVTTRRSGTFFFPNLLMSPFRFLIIAQCHVPRGTGLAPTCSKRSTQCNADRIGCENL